MQREVKLMLIFFIGITMVAISLAAVKAVAGNGQSIVWFDGEGSYHFEDPLPYLNDVLSGKIIDPEIAAAIASVCRDRKNVTQDDIVGIAGALDPLKHTAAFYPSVESITGSSKVLLDHFRAPAAAMGSITIRSFGFMAQGPVSQLSGTNRSNLLLAIPADPAVLVKATTEIINDKLQLETVLLKAADSDAWNTMAQKLGIGIGGVSMLRNLKPGPWIFYMNQNDLVTQCYRVIISGGSTKELVLEKVCTGPRKRLELKSDEKKSGS